MIRRIFHSIGQGAFYSERHENFNMVYDCGALPYTTRAEKLVKQSFHKTDVIDVLFISHFDSDHINQIETLKNHCARVKMVVLPLLRPDEKKLVSNFYQSVNNAFVPLIENPGAFFGEGTTIVYIKPYEGDEITNEPEIGIGQLRNNQEIDSGTKIRKDGEWYYIPFNLEFKSRHQSLLDLLDGASIDKDRLLNDVTYTLVHRKKLQSIYKQIEGNINQNSMFVYSGPISEPFGGQMVLRHQRFNFHGHYSYPFNNKVGCIYTGDGDLNRVQIDQIYGNEIHFVSTVQIPHHGDLKSFHSPTFGQGKLFCPISVGSTNTYGHPSSILIADLITQNNCAIIITEHPTDLYVEVIK